MNCIVVAESRVWYERNLLSEYLVVLFLFVVKMKVVYI